MVEHTVLVCRNLSHVAALEDLAGLLSAEKVIDSVKYSDFSVGLYSDGLLVECESVSLASEGLVLSLKYVERYCLAAVPVLLDLVFGNCHSGLFR